MFRAVWGVLMLAVMTACSVAPVPSPGSYPADKPPLLVPPRSEPEAPPSNQAVERLLVEARLSQQQGRLDEAVAKAERALRIQPGNAEVYYLLAQLQYQQGQWRQAWQWANKGLQYVNENGLRHQLQAMIANCEALF